MRHTFASRLVRRGVDLYTVGALLGHSTVKVTERYAHLNPQKLAQAMMVLEVGTGVKSGVSAFDPRKQGLHDKVCRTVVVRTDVPFPLPEAVEPEAPAEAAPDDPARSPGAMHSPWRPVAGEPADHP